MTGVGTTLSPPKAAPQSPQWMRAASLVVVLQDGISLPPLLFHAGGMPELIRCLQQVWSPAGEKGGGGLAT